MTRRSPEAKELATPKYRQRIVGRKRPEPKYEDYTGDDFTFGYWDDLPTNEETEDA